MVLFLDLLMGSFYYIIKSEDGGVISNNLLRYDYPSSLFILERDERMYPAYNNQFYIQDLQNTRDRIDKQLQQMQQMQSQNIPQQATPITQNFQITPSQNLGGIRYVNSKEEVKRELVFGDTLFVNREYSRMWLKNARGETKEYTLVEVIELDPKDAEIEDLRAQIRALTEGGDYNAGSNDKSIAEPIKKPKPTGVSTSSSSKK